MLLAPDIRGRRCILVDDVLTTGASLIETVDAVRTAGVESGRCDANLPWSRDKVLVNFAPGSNTDLVGSTGCSRPSCTSAPSASRIEGHASNLRGRSSSV